MCRPAGKEITGVQYIRGVCVPRRFLHIDRKFCIRVVLYTIGRKEERNFVDPKKMSLLET